MRTFRQLLLGLGAMDEVCEGKEFHFPGEEEKTLNFWKEIDAFK